MMCWYLVKNINENINFLYFFGVPIPELYKNPKLRVRRSTGSNKSCTKKKKSRR